MTKKSVSIKSINNGYIVSLSTYSDPGSVPYSSTFEEFFAIDAAGVADKVAEILADGSPVGEEVLF